MGKGKGKASGTGPRGGTRKIPQARVHTSKFKPAKSAPLAVTSSPSAAAVAAAAAARTTGVGGELRRAAGVGGDGESTKKSKKARPSEAGQAPGLGSAAKVVDSQQPVSPNRELFKMTCTCPHLANHPARASLLRKLVDVRTKVNTTLIMKEKSTVGVFGALDGERVGQLDSQCQECEEHTLNELDSVLTCLECGYTGCVSPPNRHLLRHCLTQPGGSHCFAVSRARAEIFCVHCCDYVYDVEFDAAVSRADDDFELPDFRDSVFGGDERVRGRRRRRAGRDGHYVLTDRFGQQPGRERSWPPPVLLSPARGRLVAAGVRGMFNLGNTCFMTSVLQAVLHISVMQSFFSGKGHEPAKCERLRKETSRLRSQILHYESKATTGVGSDAREGEGGGGKVDAPESGRKPSGGKKLGDYCIACELARLFDDMFSAEAASATLDDTEPYVPNRLLEAVWSASEFLAGYEQQDAHEFLIAVLDNLHGHLDRAAKNESSAPLLRRTLASHKLRAKQQQSPPPQHHNHHHELQMKHTQDNNKKKAGENNIGRGRGSLSSTPLASSPQAPATSPKGRNGDSNPDSKTTNRKRGGKDGETGYLMGWESPELFEDKSAAAMERLSERFKNEKGALSSLARQGKAQVTHGETPQGVKPITCQANGGSVVGHVYPRIPHESGKGEGELPTTRPWPIASKRDEVAKESGGARSGGGGDRSAERVDEAKGVLNGQRLEDVSLTGFVQEVFAGVTRSDVVCTACGDVSCTYERFLEVSLPVRPGEYERCHQQQQKQKPKQQGKALVAPGRVAKNNPSREVGIGSSDRSAAIFQFPDPPLAYSRVAQPNGGHESSSKLSMKGDMVEEGGYITASNGKRRESQPFSARAHSPAARPRQKPRTPPASQKKSLSKNTEARKRSLESFRNIPSGSASQVRPSPGRLFQPSTPSNQGTRPIATSVESSKSPGRKYGGVTKCSSAVAVGRRDFGRNRAASVTPPPRSISDCFARFAAREDLTARMTCDSCSASPVCKTKQMSFSSLPRVLVLHLKRFDAMSRRKIDDFVSFPARGLDMGRYLTGWPASPPKDQKPTSESTLPEQPGRQNGGACAGADALGADAATSNDVDVDRAEVPPPSLLYDLLAVVNHSGSMAQGHYTAFVREVGKWFRFDDTWVSEVSEEVVLASEAYILFYFKRGADDTWKSSPAATLPSSPSDFAAPSSPSCSNGDHALPISATAAEIKHL